MKNNFLKKLYDIQDSFFLTVIKHGLLMMIPLILVGALANAILNLPIPAYQNFICNSKASWISSLLSSINAGTFGLFSVAMVITLSLSYAMEKNEKLENTAMYIIVALGAFGTHLNIGSDSFDIGSLGVKSCFAAIFITFVSCVIFERLRKIKWLSLRDFTIGMEGICANSIQSFLPAMVCILIIAAFNRILVALTGLHSIQDLISEAFIEFFS
ncbi:MAG: hypothetical protein ACI4EN_08120, partial [Butyrivibrio sp.]